MEEAQAHSHRHLQQGGEWKDRQSSLPLTRLWCANWVKIERLSFIVMWRGRRRTKSAAFSLKKSSKHLALEQVRDAWEVPSRLLYSRRTAWEQASIVVNYSGRQWMTMDVCTWHGHGAALYCTQQLFSSSQLFMCEEGIPNVRQPYSTDQGWANLNWQKRQMKIIWEAKSTDDDPLCSDNCRRTGLTRWHHLKDEQEAKVETVNKWKPQATRSGD